ncbi:MAG: flagellar basal body P-ring protein FlgI, partial [Alphaproteobacteria bacterium]|nr:flagellar basal body P-ring protein FlgI [Alphaproteobacteria bacterium]
MSRQLEKTKQQAIAVKAVSLFMVMLTAGFILIASTIPSFANSRIKDIVNFESVRENQLVGYGLVVGLNGTGDNIDSMEFTKQSLIGMLERLGINTRDGSIKSKNVAAVVVTAKLPPFSR